MTRQNISDAVGNISTRHVEEAANFCRKKSIRFSKRFALIAALVAISSVLLGFTYGTRVINLLNGGQLIIEKGSTAISMGFETVPAEVRDGKIYFVLDGSDRDITAVCSETTYYQYETVEEDGTRHFMLVGGTPDNVGWAEFVVLTNGDVNMSAEYYGEEPVWLTSGRQVIQELCE